MRSSFSLRAGLASALLALALPAAAQAAPLATGSPDPVVFPVQALSTVSSITTVTWSIPGGSGTLGELELAGTNADDFWLVSEDCLTFVLASPSTCTAKLRFIPSAAGARTATLRFQSDPTSAVTLQGTGTASNQFVNFQSLVMQGAAWTWSGTGAFTSAVVQSGMLEVDGSIANTSGVTVNSGTTLTGVGAVAVGDGAPL